MVKRVLMVFNRFYPVLSGSENFSKMIYDHLIDSKIETDVCTLKVSDDSYLINDKNLKTEESKKNSVIKRFEIVNFPYKNRLFNIFEEYGLFKFYSLNFKILSPSMIFFLKNNIKRYDLIITGYLPFSSIVYPALYYSKKYKKKSIFIPLIHSSIPSSQRFEYEFFHPLYKEFYELSDFFISLNKREQDYLKNFKKRVFCLNPFVEIPEKVTKKVKKDFNILSIGRQNYEKGTETTLRAVDLIHNEFKDVKLTIVGKMDRKYKESIKFKDYIIYFEKVSEEKKRELFLLTDLFILPSIAEAFGIVTVEAHSYGIPTINAYCWGSEYIVKNGINGFLVPFSDHQLVYNYIKQLYLNTQLKEILSKNAREISLYGSELIEGYKVGPFDKKRFKEGMDRILEEVL